MTDKKTTSVAQLKDRVDRLKKSGNPLSGLIQKKSQRLLVAESNGFGLRALIVRYENQTITIEHTAKSTSPNPAVSVADIQQQLREAGVDLPKDAILTSSNAIPALLDLPLDGATKVGQMQMLEMVRWEMESLMTEQVSQWNIGWLLMGRGHISEDQRNEILVDMEAEAETAANRGGRAPARFGEEAIKRNYCNREQLEECLAIQESLYLLDDAIDCSWLPSSTTAGNQKGLWLCSAISAALRQEWVRAFQQQNIRLHWIYPNACTASSSICYNGSTLERLNAEGDPEPTEKLRGPQVILELQAGYVCCTRIESQQVTQIAIHKCCDRSLTVYTVSELCQPLLNAEISKVWFCGQHPRIEELIQDLAPILERPMQSLQSLQSRQCALDKAAETKVDLKLWSGVIGAAQHYLSLSPGPMAIQLQGQAPPPPIHKRPAIQLGAAAACILLAITCNEVYFVLQAGGMKSEIEENESQTAKIEYMNETTETKNEATQEVKRKLTDLQGQQLRLNKRKELIESVLIRRQNFAEALLPLVANNIPNEVIINAISENGWYKLTIDGWATNQSTIDDFNANLSRAFEQWHMTISDSPSEVEPGWSKLDGYHFVFTVIPTGAS